MMDTSGPEAHRISRHQISEYPEFIKALLKVKISAAEINREDKTISPESAEKITRAAKQLLKTQDFSDFTADPYSGGGGVLINRQMNTILSDLSKVAADDINLSQSTADTCMTAMRMALHNLLDPCLKELKETTKNLDLSAKKFSTTPSMSRTCLQDALPSTLGILFEGYAELTSRRYGTLSQLQKTLLYINLGGTVIGSGEGASEFYRNDIVQRLADVSLLELKARKNLFDAAQNSDDVLSVATEVELLARSLIKICKDLRLLASGPAHGLGEIVLPKVIQGSSFFKEKNNPTIPETVIQGSFLILGKTKVAQLAFEHSELNLNVFEFAGDFALYESLEILASSLHTFNQNCLENITLPSKASP